MLNSLARRQFNIDPITVRWVLSGPFALLLTMLLLMGSAHWVPAGVSGVDNIVLPVVLFPLIWVGVFIYALAEENLLRGSVVMGGLIVAHVVLLLAAV